MTLQEYLDREQIRPAKFARMVDVHRIQVGRWLGGALPSSPAMIKKIEQATHGAVTLDDWAQQETA